MDEDIEKTNLWNKKADELTVGDAVKINLAIPAAAVGALVVLAVSAHVVDKAAGKIRKVKSNRAAKKALKSSETSDSHVSES